jgi:hypothetical protein
MESVRFLDIVMLHGADSDRPMPTYEVELNALHDLISQVSFEAASSLAQLFCGDVDLVNLGLNEGDTFESSSEMIFEVTVYIYTSKWFHSNANLKGSV